MPLSLAPDKVGSGPRLVYLYPDYPFTLDPQNGSSFANPLGLQFFDTLVTYQMDFKTMLADQTKIVPRLAESWDDFAGQQIADVQASPRRKVLGWLAGNG